MPDRPGPTVEDPEALFEPAAHGSSPLGASELEGLHQREIPARADESHQRTVDGWNPHLIRGDRDICRMKSYIAQGHLIDVGLGQYATAVRYTRRSSSCTRPGTNSRASALRGLNHRGQNRAGRVESIRAANRLQGRAAAFLRPPHADSAESEVAGTVEGIAGGIPAIHRSAEAASRALL